MSRELSMAVPSVSVHAIHARLGLSDPLDYPTTSLEKSLLQWRMEDDDSPIFRYLYRNLRPRRHLEFGTWQGAGTLYVLEECDATVWTINLPGGEIDAEGRWAYSSNPPEPAETDRDQRFLKKVGKYLRRKVAGTPPVEPSKGFQTDTVGFIGRFYLERDLGNRVCQIYCDSRKWDVTNYPEGFFDSCLIDGGHQYEIVQSDTKNALKLVRSGGLLLWHDFCPVPDVLAHCPAPRDVVSFVKDNWAMLQSETSDLFWVDPSHILVGIRA
jgi:hypothetical protein